MCLGYLMVLIILSSPSLPATAGGRASVDSLGGPRCYYLQAFPLYIAILC